MLAVDDLPVWDVAEGSGAQLKQNASRLPAEHPGDHAGRRPRAEPVRRAARIGHPNGLRQRAAAAGHQPERVEVN